MGGNRVLKGVTGGKRISLHGRGPYMYCTNGYKDKRRRVPPTPHPSPTKEKQRERLRKAGENCVMCSYT